MKAYLSLGSNLGDREANLRASCEVLDELGISILAKSSIYEAEPWGVEDQASFLNQIVIVDTDLSPVSLVNVCKEVEKQVGRVDSFKWGPRVIDVDVVFYENQIIDFPGCIIPHYLMHERRFVLVPLAELDSGLIHPVLKKNIGTLLEECPDKSKVEKIG